MTKPTAVLSVACEDRVDDCRTLIATLAKTVARWETIARRSGIVFEEEVEAARARLTDVAKLLEDGRFLDIRNRVPLAVAHLNSDIEQIAHKAAAAAGEARQRTRRLLAAARILRTKLSASGLEVPDIFQEPEHKPAAHLEVAVATAFDLLASLTVKRVADEGQSELAGFFANGEIKLSFKAWLGGVDLAAVDPLVLLLQLRLDELRVLDPAEAERFSDKLTKISSERSSVRRAILADFLTVDISAARRSVLASLTMTSRTKPCRSEARASNYERSIDKASSQRPEHALMDGLGGVGQDRSETAQGGDSRVVLRAASEPSYEILIGTNSEVTEQPSTAEQYPIVSPQLAE